MAVVLITGCSSGFGLEAALAFARNGDTVCATMRNVAKAEPLRKRAADEGLDIEVEAMDVTDEASVTAGIAAVSKRLGPIDVLVNNAGVGYDGPIETIPFDAAMAVMDTNFWGAVRAIRAVLPSMREQRRGVIINVTSLSGLIPGALYTGIYAASKHALGTVSESLAMEAEPFGIRVVCVAPGFFKTEIGNNSEAVANGIAGSPYEIDAMWWDAFMKGSVESGADAKIVADTIVRAAHDPSTPLQVPVGADAELYTAVWKDAGTFEKWVEAALPVVEMTAGPRPAPA